MMVGLSSIAYTDATKKWVCFNNAINVSSIELQYLNLQNI